MDHREICPIIISPGERTRALRRLPRMHTEFDENYLQELLANHPEVLPVHAVREDIGPLLCIGREVPVPFGSIDNLYLSAAGYPVIVETKLWRNPQARREVLSQVLDYVKDVVCKDYEWFEKQWSLFQSLNGKEPSSLVCALSNLSDDEIDEPFIVDRVNQSLARGDIIALIVGDGIETRLQELVAHLCRDSSHLRYSLALVELCCFETGENVGDELLVVPRIVQEVEPVQRAYVRVEVSDVLKEQIKVTPVITLDSKEKKYCRVSLNEEDFFVAVQESAGCECADLMRQFYNEIVTEFSLEPEFKAAAVMLKVPHPDGDGLGASIMALEKQGRLYNSRHMLHQIKGWGLNQELAARITADYWAALNAIDPRFRVDGAVHLSHNHFIPFVEIADKLPEIKKCIGDTVSFMRTAYDKSRS